MMSGYLDMTFKTEQELFWASEFGDEYIERNMSERLLAANLKYFTSSLRSAGQIGSVVEFGANVGMNMRALKLLYPGISRYGIEINKKAANELKSVIGTDNVFNGSILDYSPVERFDVSMTKGVLIHINPDVLEDVYQKLYDSSRRFILIGEYYNPKPVTISYRGNEDKLFKRDFCGDFLDKFSDLALVDYGFAYKRDVAFSQDDITWFLMEKK
jgi:pseudaminic acid biosynthesis-associated methylase